MQQSLEEKLINRIDFISDKNHYINHGSDHLRGETWVYRERTPFAGYRINGENRREYIIRFAAEHKEKNPDADMQECVAWGIHKVRREQKHEKAYLKGWNSYKYKGGTYLVEDMSRVERFKKAAAEIEEKDRLRKLKEDNDNGRQEENSTDNNGSLGNTDIGGNN